MKAHQVLNARYERLSSLAKLCRKNRHMSLEEAAAFLGISKSVLQRMEAGELTKVQTRWIRVFEGYDPTAAETDTLRIDMGVPDELTLEEIELVKRWRSRPEEDRAWLRKNMELFNLLISSHGGTKH